MNKKGFTLIELLAIIVILAVIALIGTPIVTNIINSSRISAAARTCDGVVESVRTLYSMSVLQNANFGGATITFDSAVAAGYTITPKVEGDSIATFDYKGTMPTAGSIIIAQDGTYTFNPLTVNTYTCKSGEGTNNGVYTCTAPTS